MDGVSRIPDHDLDEAVGATGRRPGDYSSKLGLRLDAAAPAHDSLRVILLSLLDTLELNVEGTIADIDTEFLHDLRVACRRTRSAITQLKGVLDPAVMGRFNPEFKWLGAVTGPLRDLDVYLLEMPAYRSMLPEAAAADLEPLETLIAAARKRAHRDVARALGSQRFADLIAGWRTAVASAEPASGKAAIRSTADLAARRIRKAYNRILTKGDGLGNDPPAEALHRLRIDAKKLRYLLEFFRSLYPSREIAARIKELKRLQDILGGFNDMEVQRDRLTEFAAELHGAASASTSSLLTLGRLAGMLENRQEEYRLAFHSVFVDFSSGSVRDAYDQLFSGKESG
jgi:CHAD domain-containing protein